MAVLWHTRIVAPATGRPVGPNTMSSFREPCPYTVEAANAISAKRTAARAFARMFVRIGAAALREIPALIPADPSSAHGQHFEGPIVSHV